MVYKTLRIWKHVLSRKKSQKNMTITCRTITLHRIRGSGSVIFPVTSEGNWFWIHPRVEVFPERLLVFRSPQGLSVRTCFEQRNSVIDQLFVEPCKIVKQTSSSSELWRVNRFKNTTVFIFGYTDSFKLNDFVTL